jgi:hypothetical protein
MGYSLLNSIIWKSWYNKSQPNKFTKILFWKTRMLLVVRIIIKIDIYI